MDDRIRQHLLSIVIIAFVGLAICYSVVVPLGEAPDEVSHWAYVQYLIAHHSLPTPEGAARGDAAQPPLYYVVGALATFWIPQPEFEPIANPDFTFDNPETPNLLLHTRREAFPYQGVPLAWHLLRLLSVAMGAATVWGTARIAEEFLPNPSWIAVAAAAFVAFLPGFTFLSAVVNNDTLVIMLSTLAVLQSVRLARHPLEQRHAAALGVVLGLAALTKLSGLVAWFFAAAAFAVSAWQSRPWKNVLVQAALSFGIALAIVAPYFAYNWTRYGDPLGWSLTMATTPVRTVPITWNDWRVVFQGLYTSFWGRFGGALHLRMADAVYLALALFTALPIIGWTIDARRKSERTGRFDVRPIIVAFSFFWLVLLAAHVRWTLAELGTDQARQLFPGLPLFALVFTLGLAFLLPARQKAVLTTACGGLFALNIVVLVYLTTTFAGTPMRPDSLPALGAANVPADFGGKVRVADYKVETRQVAAGETLVVQVNWQALTGLDRDYWLLLQLTDSSGAVANKDGVPDAGRPTTDWWLAGQAFSSHHRFVVPADLAPGRYTLQMGLHPYGAWDWLPVNGRDMLALDTIQVTPTH